MIRLQAKHYLPDAAILSILKFIAAVLSLIDKQNGSYVAKNFPSSKDALLKQFKLKEDFKRYAVYCKCQSVYKKSTCIKKSGTHLKSKFCSFRTHHNLKK